MKKIRYIHELAYTQQGMTSVFRDWIPETGRIIDSLPVSILHPLPINPCAALFSGRGKSTVSIWSGIKSLYTDQGWNLLVFYKCGKVIDIERLGKHTIKPCIPVSLFVPSPAWAVRAARNALILKSSCNAGLRHSH